MKDYYTLLGVDFSATDDQIKRSFKKLAVKYHPDKTAEPAHHELFLQISKAYETLKSPESRRQYDLQYSTQKSATYKTTFSSTFSAGQRTPRANTSYYDFYRQTAQKEDERDRRREEAALAAKLARQRADFERKQKQHKEDVERLEREEKERFQNAERERQRRQAKEKEIMERRQREFEKREREREIQEEQKLKEAQLHDFLLSLHKTTEELRSDFRSKLRSELRKEQKNQPEEHDTTEGADVSNPIVIDDEARISSSPLDESSLAYASAEEGHDEEPQILPSESESESHLDYKKIESLFAEGLGSRRTPRSKRPVSPTRKSVSPTRRPPPRGSIPTAKGNAKKMKTNSFETSDLRLSLHQTDIDSVDFRDMLNNLPKQNPLFSPTPREGSKYGRKISEHLDSGKIKKPKLSEFSDGTSKADTLHIPVNKNVPKAHPASVKRKISVFDLHASPTIHNYVPPVAPEFPLGNLNQRTWEKYVQNIKEYETRFMRYKQNLIQYQFERSKKDEEFQSAINEDTANFEVYQSCLERDLRVIDNYLEALRVFITTMQNYKQNCSWMQMTRRDS